MIDIQNRLVEEGFKDNLDINAEHRNVVIGVQSAV